jgi:hypothetical protein
MKRITLVSIVLLFSFFATSHANETVSASPPNAKAYLISPQDGETVPTTFTVQFGLSGMGIAPAGIKKAKTGHHHLLIDTDAALLDLKKSLPANDNIKHFGGGQSEATITLTPGKHTLQLLLGNYLHIPHEKPVLSEKITVFVK